VDQHELARLERLSRLLDSQFRIPGTPIRLGIDGLLGLVPGLGDTLTLLPSAYLVLRAHQMGAGRKVVMRMAANTALDYLAGTVPVLGDVFDIAFKANRRNFALLREALEKQDGAGSSPPAG
jgi:hypothetical protein